MSIQRIVGGGQTMSQASARISALTSLFGRRRLQLLVVALTLLLAGGVLGARAFALGSGHGIQTVGALELDGDLADNRAACNPTSFTPIPVGCGDFDWFTLFSGGTSTTDPGFTPFAGVQAHAFVRDYPSAFPSGNDQTYFKAGHKDIDGNVTDTTGTHVAWECVQNSNPTDKDEINNAYAIVYQPASGERAGHTLLYFGAERFANNGDAFLGIWMFQDKVGCDAPLDHVTYPFTGAKTVGDILMQINFTNV